MLCEDIFEKRDHSATRGHSMNIYKNQVKLNLQKNSFCERVVDCWNGFK